MADYIEATVKACGEAKLAANWIMADLSAYLNKAELTIAQSQITPVQLGGLITRLADGTLSSKIAKQVFEAMTRSEEHTSELQSRGQLVCRLLLEKKKRWCKPQKQIPLSHN